ncbi:MAG: serine/threonine protein kinase [Myxococcales bacterium]|nr:serine/threonine protein kinase [Myxococcales bacterium]
MSMLEPSSSALQLVGAVFNGRWKLTRLVGEGGMGAVYEAQGVRGEGVRAIKVLHPEFVTEEQILQRFVAEAQAVRSLNHPNIAQIFDNQRAEDGTPYLVMEFLQGSPLSSAMPPGQPMQQERAAGIMLGVLQALGLAHARGIVHRDLKPDNLFLVPDGRGNQLVKVLDFGIAKVMDAAGGMGSKTKTGVLLGTPGYMSPEQIRNSKGVDPRSDLWSVGIILYEMLTGREAFTAENEFQRLTMVLTQEVRSIAEVAPQLAHWAPFFQRALSKDLNRRFQSAQEMAQALAAMVAPRSQAAPAPQPRDGGTAVLSVGSPSMHQQYGSQPQPPVQQNVGPSTLGAAQQQGYAQSPAAPPKAFSVPPPASPSMPPNQGPSTHISAGRSPGVPTLTSGSASSPAVEVMAAPPVGVPWWVVGAVGAACLVLGFIAGYLAR